MNILTLDVETGVHNQGDEAVGKMKAAPWHPNNELLLRGIKRLDWDNVSITSSDGFWDAHAGGYLFVGQNIKFDMHFMMKDEVGFREHVWPTCQLWDTMLAEYILTGQQSQYASLDNLAVKYGGVLKDDQVKDFWDSGVMTEDIPRSMLDPYLENDVLNTELIFKEQIKKAKEMGMLELIKSQMRALKATTEMEWNGMHFDKKIAHAGGEELAGKIDSIHGEMMKSSMPVFTYEFWTLHLNFGSSAHIALTLFGGEYKYKQEELMYDEHKEPILFKTGKRAGEHKKHKVEKTHTTSGFNCSTKDEYKTPTGKIGTSDGVLKDVRKTAGYEAVKFIDDILLYRKYAKDLKTYFVGYAALTWPNGLIHHALNHVGTDTGRLSSSSPNLQNVSSSEEE